MFPAIKIFRFYAIAAILLVAAWLWVLFNLQPGGAGYTTCIIKNVTGLPCPSCGTTTAVTYLLQGAWQEAFFHNPLGFLILPLMAIVPVWMLLDVMLKRNSLQRAYLQIENSLKRKPVLLGFIFVLILINWIWNLCK